MVNPFFFIKVAKGYLFFYKTDYKLKLKTIQQILKILFNLILIVCMCTPQESTLKNRA
jgi:hypothetical protein